MDLLDTLIDPTENLLPNDGTVHYFGSILPYQQADNFYQKLLHNIEWQHDKALIYGKLIETQRQVAWYGDKPFQYTYSNVKKTAKPWTKDLLAVKQIVEQIIGESFNSCLLNLYQTGEQGMAWHSDAEKDLKPFGTIASLSLGAERKFSFKHKSNKQIISIVLQHGSLLLMKNQTQHHWLHRLPPSKKINQPRVNLTFRNIVHH